MWDDSRELESSEGSLMYTTGEWCRLTGGPAAGLSATTPSWGSLWLLGFLKAQQQVPRAVSQKNQGETGSPFMA